MSDQTPTAITSENDIYGGIATSDPQLHSLLVQELYGLDDADHDVHVDLLRDLISEVTIGVIFENDQHEAFDLKYPLAQMTEADLSNISEKLDELHGQLEWRDLDVPCDGADDVEHEDGIDCEPEHWKNALEAVARDSGRVHRFGRVRREFCERRGLQAVLTA